MSNDTGEESSKMLLLGAGGAAVVIIGILLLVMGGSKTPPASAKTAETKVSEVKRSEFTATANPDPVTPSVAVRTPDPVQHTPAVPAPISGTPEPVIDDIRETFAARKWKEILDAEKNGDSPAIVKSRIEKFAETYASTKAGKEAREKLSALASAESAPATPVVVASNNVPPAILASPTPVSTPTAVVVPVASNGREEMQKAAAIPDGAILFSDFERETSGLSVETGSRVTDNAFGGSGASLKSAPNSGSQYFTSAIKLGFKNVTVKADTWVRFACYAENSKHLAMHTLFDPRVCEKFIKNIPQKKWFWVTFKLSDYDKQLNGKGPGAPDIGAKMKFTSFYSCGPNSSIQIDQFSVGEGPLPSDK